jgi:hypothetical protein
MRVLSLGLTIPLVFAIACSERSPTEPRSVLETEALMAKGGPSQDVTARWGFPLADAGLSVRSDGQFSDGSYSWYSHGVCTVSSAIFVGGSGDNTINFSYPKTAPKTVCGRTFTMVFPDGFTETLAYAGGVQILQSSSFQIPVGTQAKRHMRFGADQRGRGNPVAARCGLGLVFGEGGGNPALGSDSVVVSRLDARTWRVQSQAAPDNQAFCIDNGQLYDMTLDFLIVASRDLP